MTDRFDPEKDVDLDPSEWTYRGKKEPFWGSNAKMFAFYLAVAPVATIIASVVVTGSLPPWLLNLLQ